MARGRTCRGGLRNDGAVGWIIMSQSHLVHKDYVYTEEWVEFLKSELSDPKKRIEVLETK